MPIIPGSITPISDTVNTVRRYLEQPERPRYVRRVVARPKLGPFEPYLRERITAAGEDRIPAVVLAREIRERGYCVFRTNVTGDSD